MADPLENENNSLTTNVTRKIIWYRNVLLGAMLVTGQKRNKTIPVTPILLREQKKEPDDIPPSETQGQSVGSGEKVGRKFWSTGERAPGYRLSPRYFQKFKRVPAPVWAQKMLCIILLNRRTHLLTSFRVFLHDSYCLDHGLSGSCTREMHAVGKLSVWYKIPIWLQNTVCPKTKDAFPKIQASAYNRYSRLHRPRLA